MFNIWFIYVNIYKYNCQKYKPYLKKHENMFNITINQIQTKLVYPQNLYGQIGKTKLINTNFYGAS